MSQNAPTRHQVELCSMQVLPDSDGFVMDLANADNQAVRLEFPGWMLPQLMRALPQLDAVLNRVDGAGPNALVAHPVDGWSIASPGPGQGLALCLRDARHVETALHFSLDEARSFQHELGEAIARAQQMRPGMAARVSRLDA